MAVFTVVSDKEFSDWAHQYYPVIEPQGITPISDGIENTNYLVQGRHRRYVFTIFEVWDAPAVAYYASLLLHLGAKNLPVPVPLETTLNNRVLAWGGKPCLVVPFFNGGSVMCPQTQHCAVAGDALARLHIAVADFTTAYPNPRGYEWRRAMAKKIMPSMAGAQQKTLSDALAVDSTFSQLPLPQGACHCDFFRNNVLWENEQISGIIDFYFGGQDSLIFDLAVCACDWCFDADKQQFDDERLGALLAAYNRRRQFCYLEKQQFTNALSVAATRFWISRWGDVLFPRDAAILRAHDPAYFEVILKASLARPDNIAAILAKVA